MPSTIDFEAERLQNLQQKQALLEKLNLHSQTVKRARPIKPDPQSKNPPKKRRLNSTVPASRSSARLAGTTRISYTEEKHTILHEDDSPYRAKRPRKPKSQSIPIPPSPPLPSDYSSSDLPTLLAKYNNWTSSAPEPTLLHNGTYHFESHPTFTPNISPLSILLEGAFGGSFFAPWYSRTLHLTLQDDYLLTLPESWRAELHPPTKYIVSPTYDPSLNKYGVQCGQTQSEWEAAGWLNFDHDPRGWFEWYIRFWLGRRCDDDERQVGRWQRCVGPKGRWKRMLLKKYVEYGVRSIFDDDDDADREVRQEDLDEAWRERGR
ncbi:hypothetical protein LTR10_017942 [Elasticomyces elasticus]|uniref:Uncharacterized protein n=1 Tax=Exophiala sideris TaxID=1016849 RepID=A0ABR0IX41_9EURO|nr:hypothetical protein LTR10_017942 [Elasticomyces elasticus]KAK5021766.1 hypothetical protein LTS07_010661 [Exophiala sideris]KAK5025874.1 hypothetical protein LTR13_010338 [Exophiala sideris]KAK5050238.1 hypothetical protein LTR69_010726 [Exophiala sideris]KAK5177003.1 hypothetical protein LTR44_010440 [Eurotiomycetes sp. CCFEE 6388]